MSDPLIRRRQSEVEEESYFISMSDMLVGLLFIFIILLVYFAVTFKQKEDYLVGASEARKKLLEQLEKEIEEKIPGVDIVIDTETGILHLPEEVLFRPNEYELNVDGQKAIGVVATILTEHLPCYTKSANPSLIRCSTKHDEHTIDTILIEGHTDTDPFKGDVTGLKNLDLSTLRATRTYLALTNAQRGLSELTNGDSKSPQPVLGVAGYGPFRPVLGNDGKPLADKARHRRIDLRFIMVTPKSDAARKASKILSGQ